MTAGSQTFIRSTAKIALAIFLSLLGLGVVAALGTWGYTSYQVRQAKPYEEVRDWDVDLTENLKLKLKARTKVVSSRLLISIRFVGYPTYLSSPTNQDATFTLSFLDKDGFKVHSKLLKLQEFSSIVGPDSSKIGLDAQAEDYIDIEDYKRFARLTVEWNLDTEAKKAPEQAPEPVVLDHCAPNLSKADRLKRLAQHGAVRQIGEGNYSAGGRSIHFFYDGSLLNCR